MELISASNRAASSGWVFSSLAAMEISGAEFFFSTGSSLEVCQAAGVFS
jgi:hypothetical protein